MDKLVDRIASGVSEGCVVSARAPDLKAVSSDESGIVGRQPLCVVRPATAQDVVATIKACADAGVGIVSRGGGTGLEGGAVPVGQCVVIDMTTFDRVIEISPENRTAAVQAGVTVEHLNKLLGGHGLFFPVSPTGAAESATIGGLVSTNARGMYAMRYGSAGDNLLGVAVAMADGTIARFGHTVHHSSSGLNLAGLFAGAEGTLGVVLGALVRLHPIPQAETSMIAWFESLSDAAAFCADVAAYVVEAAAIELVSRGTVRTICSVIPDSCFAEVPGNLVMIQLHAPDEQAVTAAAQIAELAIDRDGHNFEPKRGADLWADRHRFTSIVSGMSQGGHPSRFDAAVGQNSLETYITGLEKLAAEICPGGIACIFGHAGAGIVHVLVPTGDGEGLWPATTAARFRTAGIDLALELGGTVSGEHGIGMTSIAEMARENASALPWMLAVKRAMDPAGIMNPGKVLPGIETK